MGEQAKTPQEVKDPLAISRVESTYDDRLGRRIEYMLKRGYEVMFAPVYIDTRIPSDKNPVVGAYPHFLLVFKLKE